jgi:hypothetical protein
VAIDFSFDFNCSTTCTATHPGISSVTPVVSFFLRRPQETITARAVGASVFALAEKFTTMLLHLKFMLQDRDTKYRQIICK